MIANAGAAVRRRVASAGSPRASAAASGTAQLLAGRVAFILCGYAISVMLARELGPVEYGVYGVILSVLVSIEMVSSMGVPSATANLIPQAQARAAAVGQAAKFMLLTGSLLVFGVFWILAPVLSAAFGIAAGTSLFRLAILDVPLYALYHAYQGELYGHRRFGVASMGLVVYGLSKLVGTIALIALGVSVSGALVVNVLATLGVLVYSLVMVPSTASVPDAALVRGLLRVGLPFGLYTLALQVLLSVDLWALKSLGEGQEAAVGTYVAARNIARTLALVPSVLSGVLFASLCWALARADEAMARRQIQAAGRFALIVLAPTCVVLASNGEAVMVLVYSSQYAGGGESLGLQVVAFGFLAFLDAFLHVVMAAGNRFQPTAMLLVLVGLALLANGLLIPQAGAVGAATALAGTMGIGTVLAGVLAWRRFGPLVAWPTLCRVGATTLAVAMVDSQVVASGPWLLVKLAALGALYAVLLGVSRELRRDDVHALALWRKSSV